MCAADGVISLGLITKEVPAAMADATFVHIWFKGQFQV